jgi:hypothetical protein
MAGPRLPCLPCLSNLVYDGTMFICGNNGPMNQRPGRSGSAAPHVDLMVVAVGHISSICMYSQVLVLHRMSTHTRLEVQVHLMYM